MNQLNDSRDRILAGFETLRGLSHVPGEYLSFRIGLYRAQLAAHDDFNPGMAAPLLPLRADAIALDPADLARIIAETAEAIGDNLPVKSKLEKLADHGDNLAEAAEAAAFRPDLPALESLAVETGIPREELLFFGRAVTAPYVSRMIESAGEDAVFLSPEVPICPFCGSEPGLSIIKGEDGRRFLVCSLCGLEWRFRRNRCPFCNTENSLEIITESAEAPRWIESCSNCKGYLKTLDQRRLGDQIIPLVEAIQTLYLDLIAEREGCPPGLPYVAIR
jgi:FdhE protein